MQIYMNDNVNKSIYSKLIEILFIYNLHFYSFSSTSFHFICRETSDGKLN